MVLKAEMVTNSVINEDAQDDKEKVIKLTDEIDIKRNFKCLICKNIPIKPILSCKKCEGLYCGDQCLEKMKLLFKKEE